MPSTRPPVKPPRGCLKDMPGDNASQTPNESPKPTQKVLGKMVDYFRAAIEEKEGKHFSGNDAVQIMLEFFEYAKEDFPGKKLTERNAILVLERFFCWRIIGSKTVTSNFVVCAKNIYFLLPEDEFVYARKKTSTDSKVQRTPSNSPSRIKRDGSFKRFFKNSLSIGPLTPKKLVFEDDDSSSMHNTTVSSDARVTVEDATVYKAALQSILVLLDVSDLEGIANPEIAGSADPHVSFLTSILSRMGISSARSHRMPSCSSNDNSIEDALANNEYAAFVCCARGQFFQFKSVMPFNPREECTFWAEECVSRISAWLRDLSHNGATPIIPVEFANISSAIVDQVLLCDKAWHNENRVLHCLLLMIPLSLRRHLRLVLQWISESRSTDAIRIDFVPLRPPCSPESTLPRNTLGIVHRIVDFLIPKSIGRQRQQILARALLELFEAGHFDEVPLDIQAVIENQKSDEDPTVMTFCQHQKKNVDNDEFTKNELVKMIKMLLKSDALTAVDKSERLEAFRKAHPDLYIQHFSNVSFDAAVTSPARTRSKRFSNKAFF